MHFESAKSEGAINKSRQLDDLQLESGFLYYRKHHGLAGALAFLLLEEVADVIVLLKTAFLAKGWGRTREGLSHMKAMVRTAGITGFGRAGTR